jgi:hypothetical protein
MLNKDTLVKLIRYCTVFEQEEVKNAELMEAFKEKWRRLGIFLSGI